MLYATFKTQEGDLLAFRADARIGIENDVLHRYFHECPSFLMFMIILILTSFISIEKFFSQKRRVKAFSNMVECTYCKGGGPWRRRRGKKES